MVHASRDFQEPHHDRFGTFINSLKADPGAMYVSVDARIGSRAMHKPALWKVSRYVFEACSPAEQAPYFKESRSLSKKVKTMAHSDGQSLETKFERLQRENRRWRYGMLVLFVACTSLAVWSGLRARAVAAQEERPRDDAQALYEEIHRDGHRAIELVDKTLKMGGGIPDPSSAVAVWSLRLLGTDLYRCSRNGGPRTTDPEIYLSTATGPPNAERVKAFQEHLARMKQWERRFELQAEQRFTSQMDLLEIQARRLQAEAWLVREQNKPKSL